MMKYLLTSGGVKNGKLHSALTELLGKPISEATGLCIPTAMYASPGGMDRAWDFISGKAETPMCDLGWKSLGVLELTALPGIDKAIWEPAVRKADVLLVGGGDPMYLCHWMRQSGLAELLPSLSSVYVGLSAGSMIMTPRIGSDFVGWTPPEGGDKTLGLVDFSIFPHLDHPMLPENIMPAAEKWAAELMGAGWKNEELQAAEQLAVGQKATSSKVFAYAIDDQTGIRVTDGVAEVISEGQWRAFSKT